MTKNDLLGLLEWTEEQLEKLAEPDLPTEINKDKKDYAFTTLTVDEKIMANAILTNTFVDVVISMAHLAEATYGTGDILNKINKDINVVKTVNTVIHDILKTANINVTIQITR